MKRKDTETQSFLFVVLSNDFIEKSNLSPFYSFTFEVDFLLLLNRLLKFGFFKSKKSKLIHQKTKQMKFFDRLSNGWALGKMSLATIKENPSLMLFPVVSGAAMTLIVLSFLGGGFFLFGDSITSENFHFEAPAEETTDILMYVGAFLFYLVNYFIVVFFNVGLVYCARLILEGEETSFREGISYAMTRTQTILAWAALAATVGMIIKTIQERAGSFGQILSGWAL